MNTIIERGRYRYEIFEMKDGIRIYRSIIRTDVPASEYVTAGYTEMLDGV